MTNGTATFIAVCLGLLVLEMTLVLAGIAVLLFRVSRAVQAVERVVVQAEEKFLSLQTSWMRALQGAGGLLGGFLSGRKRAAAKAAHEENLAAAR